MNHEKTTAPIGLPPIVNLLIGSSKIPKSLSLARASKTRDAPMRLLKAAESVAANRPIATNGGHKFVACMNKFAFFKSIDGQVAAVKKNRVMYVVNVNNIAPKVPFGIDRPGSLSSPDMLAPDIIPVTPLNNTPKTTGNAVISSVV